MSAPISQSIVRKQLCAMGCELFDLGIFRQDGRMLLREGWRAEQVYAAISWLRRENARGAHIFVRPHGGHALSLVDDLGAEAIARMMDAGFQPAVVVETSLGNFQAWVNHGRILSDHRFSTQAAKELARRFGGDPSSADWRHFGRLAGFTNQKPKRRLRNGLQPFVRLHQCEGRTYAAAHKFLEEVKRLAAKAVSECPPGRTCRSTSTEDSVRPIAEFHRDPRYGGDLHRADMAWALHASSRRLPEQQIRDEILHACDLSKKGGPGRQLDYAQRTAIKALSNFEPIHRERGFVLDGAAKTPSRTAQECLPFPLRCA